MKRRNDDIDASEMMNAAERVNTGLLNNNIFYLSGDICDESVEGVIKWIIYENTINQEGKSLTLYINSCGGDLSSAFALIDIMNQSKYPIRTIGIGNIISAAFLIFASGKTGERVVAKNTSIMCHQYTTGMIGKHHDIQSYTKEMTLTNQRMVDILVEATGMDPSKVKKELLSPTDLWLTAEELVKLGVADIIS